MHLPRFIKFNLFNVFFERGIYKQFIDNTSMHAINNTSIHAIDNAPIHAMDNAPLHTDDNA